MLYPKPCYNESCYKEVELYRDHVITLKPCHNFETSETKILTALFCPQSCKFQSTDFLRYYVVPSMLLTASVDDRATVSTDLGTDHQLVFNVHGWKNVRPLSNKCYCVKACLSVFSPG